MRNLTDMDAIQAWIEQHNIAHTTLVGGGFIGLEVMEALSERGISVTLLEMGEQVMAPVDPEMASALHQEIRSHGVDLRLRTALTEVCGQRRDSALHCLTVGFCRPTWLFSPSG